MHGRVPLLRSLRPAKELEHVGHGQHNTLLKAHRCLQPKQLQKTAGARETHRSLARELALVNNAHGVYSGHLSIYPRQRYTPAAEYTVSRETCLYIDFLQRFHLRQRRLFGPGVLADEGCSREKARSCQLPGSCNLPRFCWHIKSRCTCWRINGEPKPLMILHRFKLKLRETELLNL